MNRIVGVAVVWVRLWASRQGGGSSTAQASLVACCELTEVALTYVSVCFHAARSASATLNTRALEHVREEGVHVTRAGGLFRGMVWLIRVAQWFRRAPVIVLTRRADQASMLTSEGSADALGCLVLGCVRAELFAAWRQRNERAMHHI